PDANFAHLTTNTPARHNSLMNMVGTGALAGSNIPAIAASRPYYGPPGWDEAQRHDLMLSSPATGIAAVPRTHDYASVTAAPVNEGINAQTMNADLMST